MSSIFRIIALCSVSQPRVKKNPYIGEAAGSSTDRGITPPPSSRVATWCSIGGPPGTASWKERREWVQSFREILDRWIALTVKREGAAGGWLGGGGLGKMGALLANNVYPSTVGLACVRPRHEATRPSARTQGRV